MLDAVNLEARGISTLTFVTQPFEGAARTHARMRGLPDLRLVTIPSDYLYWADEAIEAKLVSLIDEIIGKLTA